jgi:CRISPR system Cascade subunit CasC
MFMQIHTLTSYHATLLNRDDAGLAKRIPFGNRDRLRISSQCLKRHWTEKIRVIIAHPKGFRTRHFFSREILPRLTDEKGISRDLAESLVSELIKTIIKLKEGGEGQEDRGEDAFMLKQPVLFGKPEADFFVHLLVECAGEKDPNKAIGERLKTGKKNFQAMLCQAGYGNLYAGIEGALFGRFVTSDILARCDGAVHVAHAFTVHALDTEVDYFTVVDDLNREEETGAAHAGDMELGAGVYYGYVVIDIPLLISNLTGCDPSKWEEQDPTDACDVLKSLIQTISTVSPGAKLGSTAPYAYTDFILLEAGNQQPRSLANAFLEALPIKGDLILTAMNALANHLKSLDNMYGQTSDLRLAASTKSNWNSTIAELLSLDTAVGNILKDIFGEKYNGDIAA